VARQRRIHVSQLGKLQQIYLRPTNYGEFPAITSAQR
jgi:hypothetical protein